MKLMRPGKTIAMNATFNGNIINLNFKNLMYILTNPKVETECKCYRCGHISKVEIKYCTSCVEDGFQIRMIKIMEK